jgi:hypothetical protein
VLANRSYYLISETYLPTAGTSPNTLLTIKNWWLNVFLGQFMYYSLQISILLTHNHPSRKSHSQPTHSYLTVYVSSPHNGNVYLHNIRLLKNWEIMKYVYMVYFYISTRIFHVIVEIIIEFVSVKVCFFLYLQLKYVAKYCRCLIGAFTGSLIASTFTFR